MSAKKSCAARLAVLDWRTSMRHAANAQHTMNSMPIPSSATSHMAATAPPR
jgi:hypothetical protein